MIEVDCTDKINIPELPISFICGKEAIEHFGIYEPEYGFTVYLILQSEIGNWMPFFPKSNNIIAYCIPSGNTFASFIKAFTEMIEINKIDFKPLKFINLKDKNDSNI